MEDSPQMRVGNGTKNAFKLRKIPGGVNIQRHGHCENSQGSDLSTDAPSRCPAAQGGACHPPSGMT